MKLIPKLSHSHIQYISYFNISLTCVYTHMMKISQMLRSWETEEMMLFM